MCGIIFPTGEANRRQTAHDFFRLLAFYIASNTLSSIYWAIPFGQKEADTMMKQSQDALSWYDGMRNPVPTWYVNDWGMSK